MESIQKAIKDAAQRLKVNLSQLNLHLSENMAKAISTVREREVGPHISKLPENVQLKIFGHMNKTQQAAVASSSKAMFKMHQAEIQRRKDLPLSHEVLHTYFKFLLELVNVMRPNERLMIEFLCPKKAIDKFRKVIIIYDKSTERQFRYMTNPRSVQRFEELDELFYATEDLFKNAYTWGGFSGEFKQSILSLDDTVDKERTVVFEKVFREWLTDPIMDLFKKAGFPLTKHPMPIRPIPTYVFVANEQYLGATSTFEFLMTYKSQYDFSNKNHYHYLAKFGDWKTPLKNGAYVLSPDYDSFRRKHIPVSLFAGST